MFFRGSKEKNLKVIFTTHSIDGFAMSLVGIFIPIYFLTLGYPVAAVIKFFIVYYAAGIAGAFLAVYIAGFIGLQRLLIVRAPLVILFFGLMYLLGTHDINIYLIAIVGGVQNLFYWTPINILFARNTESKELGRQQSKMMIFSQMAGLLGPVLGGIIAGSLGFKYLLALVFIILAFSSLPLFFLKNAAHFSFVKTLASVPRLFGLSHPHSPGLAESVLIKPSFKFEFKKLKTLYRKYPKFFWAEVVDNMGEEVEAIIWPIFVYLSLMSIESVGLMGAAIGLGAMAFTIFIGNLSDKYKKENIIKVGAVCLGLVWLARYFTDSAFTIYLISLVSGFITVLYIVPFSTLIIQVGKLDKRILDEFFVFREIPVGLGRIIMLSIALLFVNNLPALFPVTGLIYLFFLFI